MSNKLLIKLRNSQQGDLSSIEFICTKYTPRIINLSKKLFYEEGKSDLFIFLLKIIHKLDLSIFENRSEEELDSYLNKSLQNECFTLMKKQIKTKVTLISYDDYISNDYYYDEHSNLEKLDIDKYLLPLNTTQRRIILEKVFNNTKDIDLAANQGIWALLSIILIFYILKAQEKRDIKQERREYKYQEIINKLSDKLNIIDDIKDDLEEIKNFLGK